MSGSKDTDPCFRFYGLMAECDLVALHILSTSDGRCLGTPETLLKFPHSIDALPNEVRTQLAQKKLDSLKEFLQRLESRVPSAPAPIMETTNQPSRAATIGQGGSSGPAPNIGTALPMLSCPPLPQAFKTVWQKSKTKMGVSRTDPKYYHQRNFLIGAAVFK